jgi:TadE-like protein.
MSRKAPAGPLGAARQREHGQVLVLFAFILVVLLLISALAIDYGGWLLARRTYQNVADQAAISGAAMLTNGIELECTTSKPSKNYCAREAAWGVVKDSLGLSGLTPSIQAGLPSGVAYQEKAYRIWIASPPSDAGAAYPGTASSVKTIFVRVERDIAANLSRIVRPSATVSAWATAGRIPDSFAILTLCGPPDCEPPNGENLKVNGANSTLVVESGDVGSNSYIKTAGTSAAVALSDQSTAYMRYPGECTAGAVQCLLVTWIPPRDDSLLRPALAIPEILDPNYAKPNINATTAPWQCYPVASRPAVPPLTAALPADDAGPMLAQGDSQLQPVSYVWPIPNSSVALAAPTSQGTVTDASLGGNLSGVRVEAWLGGTSAAFSITDASGAYSITTLSSGVSYNITASKLNYISQTVTVTMPNGNGKLTTNFSLLGNPGTLTGTVKSATTSLPIAGATVSVAGGGGAVVTDALGNYTITNVAAGTRSVTAGASGYTPLTLTVVMPPGGPATLNFNLGPTGTIAGTVTSGGVLLAGVTVTVTGGGSAITDGAGSYSIAGVLPGTRTVTASLAGYVASPNPGTVTVTAGGTVTQNFTMTVIPTATLTGTITDATTNLAIPGATVVLSGPSSGSTTTNTTSPVGQYTFTGRTLGSGYRITVSLAGYTTNQSALFNMTASSPPSYTQNLALWPVHCATGSAGSSYGEWDCGYGGASGAGCPAVLNPTGPGGADVTCTAFDATNRIRPGTYKDITIGNGECAWIDPLGLPTGLEGAGTTTTADDQMPGIVHITGSLKIGAGAILFGDGVTLVFRSGASMSVGHDGGFVLNYKDGAGNYRTGNRTNCDGTVASLSQGAWTTRTRPTWDTSVNPPCYVTTGPDPSEIGMAFYLDGEDTAGGGGRFDLSGQMGFLFEGVLYGPRDDIGLGGQGGQAAAGQIVAWTLTYSGSTTIYQRYGGLQGNLPPYLIEPHLGQ